MRRVDTRFTVVDQGDVRFVTLDAPAVRNALTPFAARSLADVFRGIGTGANRPRVIVLRGAGGYFCAGLDLGGGGDGPSAARSMSALFLSVIRCPVPVVACVEGGAIAGGCGLAVACDSVLATEDARFGFPEVRRGLVPAMVGALLESRGRLDAVRDLLLTGELVSAAEALRRGLAHRVVPAVAIEAAVSTQVGEFRRVAPQAFARTKALVCDSRALAKALVRARREFVQAYRSKEAGEGMEAFRDRRAPSWAE